MSGPGDPPGRETPAAPESDLLRNRRENWKRVGELGYPLWPVKFPITETVSDVGERYRGESGETLEARKVPVTTAGRVLAKRTAGKAGFLDLSDGRSRLQVYLRRDAVGDAAFELYNALDLGDWLGVEGDVFKTRTGELLGQGPDSDVPGQVPPSAPGKVARPEGRGAPLSPALPGPRRQSGVP